MSKGYLEAFKNLKQELYYSPNQLPDIDKWHENIEQALQRLEAIDNANPSEALKCLKYLYEDAKIESGWVQKHCITYAEEFEHNDRIKPYYENIKQALLKAQEQEKALKIIKKKRVDVYALVIAYDLEDYNNMIKHTYELTQKEYDLLKGVIC